MQCLALPSQADAREGLALSGYLKRTATLDLGIGKDYRVIEVSHYSSGSASELFSEL